MVAWQSDLKVLVCISERWNSADFTFLLDREPVPQFPPVEVLSLGAGWFWYQSRHQPQLKRLSLTCFVYWNLTKQGMSGDFETLSQAQVKGTESGIPAYLRAQSSLIASTLHENTALCAGAGPDSPYQFFLSASPAIIRCCIPFHYLIFPLGKTEVL